MIPEQRPYLGLALALGLALLLPAGAKERDRSSQKEEERPRTKARESVEGERSSRRPPPNRPPGDRPREDKDRDERKRRRHREEPCPDPATISEVPYDGWDDNIIVEVRPRSAEIYAGGLRYGKRKAKFGLPSGSWQLELRAPGYETEVIHLEVQQGIRYHVKRTLRARTLASEAAGGGAK